MFMRKKKKVSRLIPEADIGDFEAPDISGFRPINDSDAGMVSKLAKEFRSTGAIERTEISMDRQSLNELGEVFREAKERQKYEKDINPSFYDEAANSFLEDRESREGDVFENPVFDGIDDYGTQVYDRIVMSEESNPAAGAVEGDQSRMRRI